MSEFFPTTKRDLAAFNQGVDTVRLLIASSIEALEGAKINHIHRDFVQQAFAALVEECEGCKLTTEPETAL